MAVDDPLPGSAKGTTLVGWSKTASDPSPFSGTVLQSILTGEMYAISIDGISAAEIDVTALNDAAKRYILGTRDGGTITVRSFVTPSSIPLPVTGDSTPRNYRLHFPRKRYDPLDPESNYALVTVFSAYLQSVVLEAAVDDAVRVTYTLRLSGQVAMAWASVAEGFGEPDPL
jgi:hypothetical protein